MRRCLAATRLNTRRPWILCRASTPAVRYIGDAAASTPDYENLPKTDDQLTPTPSKQNASSASQSDEDSPALPTNLPLSPLLDPKLIAAHERYRKPKPAPSGELSPFSKKLQNNPYAQALATPIRQCRFTGLRLPEYFHLSFGLQNHPKTGKPWHLPKMALDHVQEAPPTNESEGRVDALAQEGLQNQQLPNTSPQTSTAQEKVPTRTISGTHLIAHKPTVSFISHLPKRQHPNLFPYRWKKGSGVDVKDIVWREDMHDYVLELMKRDIVLQLKYLASRPSAYVMECGTYDQIQEKAQLGAALWFGGEDGGVSVIDEETGSEKRDDNPDGEERKEKEKEEVKMEKDRMVEDGPPPYAMLDYRGRYIPIYNAQKLLGGEYVQELRESNARFQGNMAVLRQKRNTVKVHLALWRLMGYLAPME